MERMRESGRLLPEGSNDVNPALICVVALVVMLLCNLGCQDSHVAPQPKRETSASSVVAQTSPASLARRTHNTAEFEKQFGGHRTGRGHDDSDPTLFHQLDEHSHGTAM